MDFESNALTTRPSQLSGPPSPRGTEDRPEQLPWREEQGLPRPPRALCRSPRDRPRRAAPHPHLFFALRAPLPSSAEVGAPGGRGRKPLIPAAVVGGLGRNPSPLPPKRRVDKLPRTGPRSSPALYRPHRRHARTGRQWSGVRLGLQCSPWSPRVCPHLPPYFPAPVSPALGSWTPTRRACGLPLGQSHCHLNTYLRPLRVLPDPSACLPACLSPVSGSQLLLFYIIHAAGPFSWFR